MVKVCYLFFISFAFPFHRVNRPTTLTIHENSNSFSYFVTIVAPFLCSTVKFSFLFNNFQTPVVCGRPRSLKLLIVLRLLRQQQTAAGSGPAVLSCWLLSVLHAELTMLSLIQSGNIKWQTDRQTVVWHTIQSISVFVF